MRVPRALTEPQKEFLLNYFFKHEKCPGWKNIATKLITTGSCIVAGEGCIWKAGIGNFINTEVAKDAVGCSLYKFDLEYFLTSEWYKQIRENYIPVLAQKRDEINIEYEKACAAVNDIDDLI